MPGPPQPEEIISVVRAFAEKYPTRRRALDEHLVLPGRARPSCSSSTTRRAAARSRRVRRRLQARAVYSVFSDLPEQASTTVTAQLQPIKVAAGEIIVRQGAPADKFFIIVKGEVERHPRGATAARTARDAARGQFFGEIAILRDTPRKATARAETDACCSPCSGRRSRELVARLPRHDRGLRPGDQAADGARRRLSR